MEYPKVERHRSSFDAKAESPRVPHRMSFDASMGHRHSGSSDQLRASFDARDLSRASLDIKDAVRASFQKERSRSSVDGRDGSLRESPRFGVSRYLRDAPRSSVDGREERIPDQIRASVESPRLSVRLKEAVRAAVEGRLDSVRSSFDSKEALRSASNRSRDASRGSADHRLLVELRESPRLSRDGPRYSCDGRDVVRSTVECNTSKDSLRVVAQKVRETPRLSVDGRAVTPRTSSLDDREPPRSDQAIGEPRRRVPSLVARLMGLEDLPDEKPPSQQILVPNDIPVPQQIIVPQKRPSKESKLLKGLLQYNPRPDTPSLNEPRQVESQGQEQPALKHLFIRPQPSDDVATQPSFWTGNQESPRPLKLSPRHLSLETMPPEFKQHDAREIGALRQKVVHSMPKHLSEAVLTVLKNADDSRRMPMTYSEMENRLRQLRLRSTLQDHKTLRQILEAMQSKGLLNGASRPKDVPSEHELRHQDDLRPQQEAKYQNPPKHIMLPRTQDYSTDASKVRNLQELKKLGSRLHEQVFGTMPEENAKPTRPQSQALQKPVRSPDEQSSPSSGAPIVVMKPIGKPVKKIRAQNPALLIESMPGARSPQRGKDSGGRTSPWGSPVNRSARTQPGFGFGREPTGRFNSEESASFKVRREKVLARAATRDVQSEPSTPRSPKLIALPQSTAKLRSTSVSKEAPDSLRQLKVTPIAGGKVGQSGRRGRSPATRGDKEESSKSPAGVSMRSQSGREVSGLKKSLSEPEQKDQKLRRNNSDGKLASPSDREGTKSAVPSEVTILRNRSSMGKRVTLPEPDLRPSPPTPRKVVVSASKSGAGSEDKPKEKNSPSKAINQGSTTPKSSPKNNAEHTKKKEEPAGGLDHVRVTDGVATDQSSVRAPLVGLTNILPSTEIGQGELEREGVRTPRTGIIVKKMFTNHEEENILADIIEIVSEQEQPSPVSVLDGAPFREEDVSPLTLSKIDDVMQGIRDDRRDRNICVIQQADTALQDRREEVVVSKEYTPVEDVSQQLTFLRESAKILPPQGEIKRLVLQSQAEKVYVRDILVVSGAVTGLQAVSLSSSMIDATVFDYLEEKQRFTGYGSEDKSEDGHDSEKCEWDKERQVLDRRMLFDCVNDALATVLVPYVNSQPWMQGLRVPPLRKRPTGQALVQELWDQLQSLPPQKPCEDICDSLYIVLQKDLVQPRNSWSDFGTEIEDIGLEIEKMIFNELVDETLFDLTGNEL